MLDNTLQFLLAKLFMPAKNNSADLNQKGSRRLVIITGYYGFDNLGDEAILEELLHEVSSISSKDNIVVLSNKPAETTDLYGVKSVNRWHWSEYKNLFNNHALLISGGGGLFQDRAGLKSVIFYAGQIFMAKLLGAKVFIYAQGLGPLKSVWARLVTQLAFSCADNITVRDYKSMAILEDWQLKGKLTADPVWALSPSVLPNAVSKIVDNLREQGDKVIGLSLREDSLLKDYHLRYLAQGIAETYPQSVVLLLPLQQKQDLPLLKQQSKYLTERGIKTLILDSSLLNKPSYWLALMEKVDLLIGMRLHALLMALKAAKPVIGITYDPKVNILLTDFEQAQLSLENKNESHMQDEWLKTIKESKNVNFNQSTKGKLAAAQKLAQQNAVELANTLRG